ncbi:Transcriptional regulator [gamma proteobacterium HdN1]|nr:Transcriptional regulator [gamma proteobacterium HdN1]
MTSLGFASIPALQQYLKTAEACGVKVQPLLDQVGLTQTVLADNRQRISGATLQLLLAELIPASADPLFGLHTSAYVQPASYSVLGYIAMNCATLSEALAKVPVYEKIVGDMGVTRILQVDQELFAKGEAVAVGNVQVRWQCGFDDPFVRRHVIENVLASWTRYSRWVGERQDQSPVCVYLEHARPENTQNEAYVAVFGCPVHFSQPFSGLEITPQQMQLPIRQADPVLLNTLLEHAAKLLAEIDRDARWSQRVSNLLRLMIRKELPRKEAVADQLCVTTRTLQRKLEEEGVSYQQVLDQLRLEMAHDYLSNNSLSVDEIAPMLGFAESRSFHRRFKQWTGLTPGQYRERLS